MNDSGIVIDDNSMLLYGLDILEGMTSKLERGERIEIADAATVLKFLRFLGEQCLSEHAEGKTLIAGIEGALRSRMGAAFIHGSRRLGPILRSELRSTTASRDDRPVSGRSSEAMAQAEVHAGLSRLAKKYIPVSGPTSFG